MESIVRVNLALNLLQPWIVALPIPRLPICHEWIDVPSICTKVDIGGTAFNDFIEIVEPLSVPVGDTWYPDDVGLEEELLREVVGLRYRAKF